MNFLISIGSMLTAGWHKDPNFLSLYDSKYDIPKHEANYTDARGVSHPLWAKPFFEKEYKTFDQAFGVENQEMTSDQIYQEFVKPATKCLDKCYVKYFKFSNSEKNIGGYRECKIECYDQELKTI